MRTDEREYELKASSRLLKMILFAKVEWWAVICFLKIWDRRSLSHIDRLISAIDLCNAEKSKVLRTTPEESVLCVKDYLEVKPRDIFKVNIIKLSSSQ